MFLKIHFIIVAFIVASLCVCESAQAARQYRCYGRVQYRPCEMPSNAIASLRPLAQSITPDTILPDSDATLPLATASSYTRLPVSYQKQKKRTPLGLPVLKYAKVLTSNMQKVFPAEGIWNGRIEGNGVVHLELQIYRQGSLESRRYMGNVPLRNKSTAFRFRTVLPRGQEWSWKIIASAS